jgi:hypothetical protein
MIGQLMSDLAQPLLKLDYTFCTQVRKGCRGDEADYQALRFARARGRETEPPQTIESR